MKRANVKLNVKGMTCASCVAVVERALKKADGVDKASVNLSTETAIVEYDENKINERDLIDLVNKKGYTASIFNEKDQELLEQEKNKELSKTRHLLYFSIALAIPAFIAGMIFMHFPYRVYVLFALATPVQFIAGYGFYRGAFAALRNKSANMDTLIVVGTSAAYIYSLFLMAAATPEQVMMGGPEQYFETSAVLITLVLVGKYLEARAKGKTSSAIKKLMGLAPKTARVVKNGKEIEILIDQVLVGPFHSTL